MQNTTNEIDENLDDAFVSSFACSNVRSVSSKARARLSVVGDAGKLHCTRDTGKGTTEVQLAQRFRDFFA